MWYVDKPRRWWEPLAAWLLKERWWWKLNAELNWAPDHSISARLGSFWLGVDWFNGAFMNDCIGRHRTASRWGYGWTIGWVNGEARRAMKEYLA